MKTILMTFFSFFFLLSCSSNNKAQIKKDNDQFYELASRAKSEMKKSDYKIWLNKQLDHKRSELEAMTGIKDREEKVLGQYEVMVESSTRNGNQQDIHEFKADRSRQNLYRMQNRRQMLERHIFYLNSQLSELDPPLKP